MLHIENSIVTLDDMDWQSYIAQQIIKKKGDYILSPKGNYSGMQAEIEAWWHKSEREGLSDKMFSQHRDVSSKHGRIETRTCQ